MYRLKQAEDEKQYTKWSQSSSSSSWQWQTNWWESDYEHSPQRWYDHWLNGVTRYFVANYSFAVWVSASIEFKNFYREYISVTADGSLLSPTGSVNTIHPAPEIHEHFMIQQATEHCVQLHAQSQQSWDHCDQLHERHDSHRRANHAPLSTMRAPFRCVVVHVFTPSHWLKGLVRVLSPHPIHACARGCLSVFFLLSFYLLSKFLFHLFLIPAMVPDENSMNIPLCNSAIGSMVSLDYVTPDTLLAYWSKR